MSAASTGRTSRTCRDAVAEAAALYREIVDLCALSLALAGVGGALAALLAFGFGGAPVLYYLGVQP